jgi:2-iminobutanoate/2-iminopropanoate deaminase
MTRNEIVTDEIAQPVGPFSAAVTTSRLLYLSGQVAQDPSSGKLVAGGVAEQTEQIFKNAAAILRAAGKDQWESCSKTRYTRAQPLYSRAD